MEMERTQIYLDRNQKEELQKMARERGASMAELIREAVIEYIAKSKEESVNKIAQTKGLWADRAEITDSDSYVNEIRKQWNIGVSDNPGIFNTLGTEESK